MLRIATIIIFTSIISVQTAWAGVTKNTIQQGTSDVVAQVPEDTTEGTYYVLQFDIPQGITSAGVMDAVLEFYADISAATLEISQAVPMMAKSAMSRSAMMSAAPRRLFD